MWERISYVKICKMLKQVLHDSLNLSSEKVNTFSPLGRGIKGVVKYFELTLTRIRKVRKAH